MTAEAEVEVEAGATTNTVVVTCVCGAAVEVGLELTVTVAVTVSVTTLTLAGELEAAAFAAVAAALEDAVAVSDTDAEVVAFAFDVVVDDLAIVEIDGADVDSLADGDVAAEPEVSCWTTTQLPKPAVLVNEARQRSLLVPPVHCVSEGIWMNRFSDPVLDGFYKGELKLICSLRR